MYIKDPLSKTGASFKEKIKAFCVYIFKKKTTFWINLMGNM